MVPRRLPYPESGLIASFLKMCQAASFPVSETAYQDLAQASTDHEDLFYAHVGGMDTFARALITADAVLGKSDYKKFRTDRYASFDTGKGKEYEEGKLSLEDLRAYAAENGEPAVISGRQEYLENIINRYI